MSNDERIYWSVIAISLWVVAYAFLVFSMEAMKCERFFLSLL